MSDPLIIKRCMGALQSKYILTDDEAKGMTEIVISTAKTLWEDPPRSNSEGDAQAKFTEYFVKNYPGPDTIIFDPKWHAPKIFRAAVNAIQSSAPSHRASNKG